MSQSGVLDWTAVSLSNSVPKEVVVRAMVGETDLAVWRGKDGKPRVWQNRCPHRGMRLSYGFVRENRLTCLYHGWGYDGEGQCSRIPAHPDLKPPKTITVGRYQCVEKAGMIWVASEDIDEPLSDFGDKWISCRSVHIRAPHNAVQKVIGAHTHTKTFPLEGGQFLCAFQPHNDLETMIHISVSDLSLRHAANLWALSLRRQAERDEDGK